MNYKNLNDYELLYHVKEKDDESVEILIKKYEPIIIALAKKFFNKIKYQGADLNDLIQEGRIAVLRAINSYDINNNSLFYTYVSVCVKNHLITYCRNLDSKKNTPLNYSLTEEYFYNVCDSSFEPIDYLKNKRIDELIIFEKNELSFLDSCIFELRYNGFSYKEISVLMDISLSSVSRRLCKIRKSLQLLKDKF